MEAAIYTRFWRFFLVCLSFVVVLPSLATGSAQLVVQAAERERWHGQDNLGAEGYGKRIAMDGDFMVTAGEFKAVVWAHFAEGWKATQVLDPQIGRIEDVAISGFRIVLGAPLALYGQKWPLDGTAAIYVFNPPVGWELEGTLITPDNATVGYEVHNFGSSVDIDGDTLVVGAPDSRTLPPFPEDGPGFAFIYRRNGASWVYDVSVSDESHPWRFFGASVDLAGSRLAVAAPRDPDFAGPNEYGAAFILGYDGDEWALERQVDPISTPDPFTDNNFARFVAGDDTNGQTVVVAADDGVKFANNFFGTWSEQVIDLPERTVSRITQGVDLDDGTALYVDRAGGEVVVLSLTNNQWTANGVLPGGLASQPWGVAVGQSRAAVGYPLENVAGIHTGRIVTYSFGLLDEVLAYGIAEMGDDFGVVVDAAEHGGGSAGAMVGAPSDQRDGVPVGAAYRYAYDAVGDQWTKSERWQPAGLSDNAGFGSAVVYNGGLEYAASAPGNQVGGVDVGSVFVRHSGSGILQLDGPAADEGFGQGIAYRGDHLLVGAPTHGGGGGVYAYRYDGGTDTWVRSVAPLVPPGLSAFAAAGTALDTDGHWLVVGAPFDEGDGASAGAAFVYELVAGEWVYHSRLELLMGTYFADHFGQAVALAGDFAFVGAPGDSNMARHEGAVHVYQWDGSAWQWVDKLAAANPHDGDGFGISLSLVGHDLFVGAPGVDNGADRDVGATYPYRRDGDTWIATTGRILHNAPVEDDLASKSLAFVNDMLLVGAPGEDGAAADAGAVVVFDYSARVEVPSPLAPGQPPCTGAFEFDFSQRFVPPVSQSTNRNFSNVVDLSADTMIVSEPSAEFDFIDAGGQPKSVISGAVHIYRRTSVSQWIRETTLFPPLEDVDPGLQVPLFGIAAAIDGDLLVIGNWHTNWVYVYERTGTGWELRTRLFTPNPGWGFGACGLDISGSTIMVGECNYPALGLTGAGQVYFYERSGETTWVLNAGPLPSLDAEFGQHFGYQVAIDAATGRAVATGDGGAHPHTAYLYERVGGAWQEAGRLEGDPHGASIWFGRALDIDGATVVVGDQLHNGVTGPGAVFVWEHDGAAWTGPDLLIDGGISYSDSAGESVAIDGDLIVIGAPDAYAQSPSGPRTGAAYVYGRQGGVWSERLRVLPDDLSLLRFGTVTGVSAGIAAAGTLNQSSPGPREGTAYAYDLICFVPEAQGWALRAAVLCALGTVARRRRRARA